MISCRLGLKVLQACLKINHFLLLDFSKRFISINSLKMALAVRVVFFFESRCLAGTLGSELRVTVES